MKKIVILVSAFLCFTLAGTAQNKLKAEKAFLAKLNSALYNTEAESQGIGFPDAKTIILPFSIDKKGNLMLTISRINADSFSVISNMVAPINKIKSVEYDLYLILQFTGDNVTWYSSEPNSKKIAKSSKTNELSIGAPWPEDKLHQIELQKLLNAVLKYYKK